MRPLLFAIVIVLWNSLSPQGSHAEVSPEVCADTVETLSHPLRHNQRHRWSSDLVVHTIAWLDQQGFSLNPMELRNPNNTKLHEALSALLGHPTTGNHLYRAGRRYFETWPAALKAAQLNAQDHRAQAAWSRERVIRVFQALKARNHRCGLRNVRDQLDPEIRQITEELFGFAAGSSALINAVERYFGSWDEALRAAGRLPAQERRYHTWTPEMIIHTLQTLAEIGLPLRSTIFTAQHRDLLARPMEMALGFSISPGAFRDQVYVHFGNWANIWEAAGLERDLAHHSGLSLREALTEYRNTPPWEAEYPIVFSSLGRVHPLRMVRLLLWTGWDQDEFLAELGIIHIESASREERTQAIRQALMDWFPEENWTKPLAQVNFPSGRSLALMARDWRQSPDRLAEALGIPLSHIEQWMGGVRRWTPFLTGNLRAAYGSRVSHWLGDSFEEFPFRDRRYRPYFSFVSVMPRTDLSGEK